MGVYSDLEILEAVKSGHIIIDPLVSEHIRGSSVDVTLGSWFYTTDRVENQLSYNPYDPADVERYFNLKEAVTHKRWSELHGGMRFVGIEDGQRIIVLMPHERILAHTTEFIGINPPGTSEMRARSTTGRNGIVVCKDAGWGDPGYINRWTMEIQNDNDHWVPLLVGMRIAQIVFHHTGQVSYSYGEDGKYQLGSDIAAIREAWTPKQMLPQAFKDLRNLKKEGM